MMFLTSRSATMRRVTTALAASLIGAVLVACAGSDGNGDGATAAPATQSPDGVVTVSSDNLQFSTDQIIVAAGEAFTIEYTNEESAAHNITIYTDESMTEAIFVGDVINGPDEITYEIPALEPGEYYFQCDIHPDMNGTVTAG